MAQIQKKDETSSIATQYVTFSLGKEVYGIPITKLNEIIAYQELTALPNVPSFIKGILNLRGTAVPVIDMRERFNLERKDYDQFTVIMIMDVSGRTMGLVVDSVSDVLNIDHNNIKPSPQFSSSINTKYIEGMVGYDNGRKFIMLLDVDRIFTDEELNIVDGV